jgi:uncharacterized protein (TIGR02679 family)
VVTGAAGDPDLARLRRLLGGDDLSWLIDRARARLERGLPLEGIVALDPATEAQRRAVARLLGRPAGRGASLHVPLEAVDTVVRRGGLARDLAGAVEVLGGPIVDRTAARDAADAAWAAALAPAEQAAERRPALAQWVEWLRATGLLRRLAGGDPEAARRLAAQAVSVLDRLPADGQPLPVLAAAVSDGHVLDANRPLATLVLRAAADIGGVAPGGAGAEWRRTVWASVGVLDGELTNPVLALNLPGDPETATGRTLGIGAEAGQPLHLTARQLIRDPPELPVRGRTVFVCENPSVVAAAANRLGAGSAPLVCANAHPGAAGTLLLRQLAGAGARLCYHGDFDWPGITIANGIIARFAAAPWRLDAGCYRSAAARGGPRLRGSPVTATWEPPLTEAMLALGVKVEEERVLDDLLVDLVS